MSGGARIWVGGLPEKIVEDDIREEYEKYGKVTGIQIRHVQGKCSFAFVQFSDSKDAEEAVRQTDQGKLFGMRFVKVSWPKDPGRTMDRDTRNRSRSPPRRRSRSRSRSPRRRSPTPPRRRSPSPVRQPRRDDSRKRPTSNQDGHRNGRAQSEQRYDRSPPRQRSREAQQRRSSSDVKGKYRVSVENLPSDMDWKELKTLGSTFAKLGQCTFARTNSDCSGELEYTAVEDMERAIRELDDRRISGAGRLKAYEQREQRRW